MLITSRTNATVTWASSLHEKKYREKYKSFLCEGVKLVKEALLAKVTISHVFLCEDVKNQEIMDLFDVCCKRTDSTKSAFLGTKTEENAMPSAGGYHLSSGVFGKISTEKSPQGIIIVVKHLDNFKKMTTINNSAENIAEHNTEHNTKNDEDKKTEHLPLKGKILALYAMQDPSNLGAIMRSAVATGVGSMMLLESCVDIYHPKVLRASMGAVFRLQLRTCQNALEAVQALKKAGRRVFAAELREGAVSIEDLQLESSDVFVIGNEGHGIPEELSQAMDKSVYLPIATGVESLNAAVAASIILWEQRRFS